MILGLYKFRTGGFAPPSRVTRPPPPHSPLPSLASSRRPRAGTRDQEAQPSHPKLLRELPHVLRPVRRLRRLLLLPLQLLLNHGVVERGLVRVHFLRPVVLCLRPRALRRPLRVLVALHAVYLPVLVALLLLARRVAVGGPEVRGQRRHRPALFPRRRKDLLAEEVVELSPFLTVSYPVVAEPVVFLQLVPRLPRPVQ